MLKTALAILAALAAAGLAPAGEAPAEDAWAACRKQAAACKARSDFDAARTVLRAFLDGHPGAAGSAEAREELRLVEAAADKQLGALLEDAETFSRRKLYDRALEFYTELITRNSGPEWVTKARQGIERNDAAAEPAYSAARKKAEAAFAAWDFTEAAGAAGHGRSELAGTRWAEPAARLAFETEAVRKLFVGLAARVAATAANPKKTPFRLPDATGWLEHAKILRADERRLEVDVAGAGQVLPWKDMTSERMLELMGLYGLGPADRLALGILFTRLGWKDPAQVEFMAARADPMLFETADHYLQALSGRLNRLVYDFTQGLQVLDWEARCGRWLILKGELVQEGAEGEGELLLAKRSYRADQVRFFFDLTDRGGKGIIAVTFVQGPADAFGFAFSREEGYSAFASVGGRVTTVKEPKFRLPADKRVRIRCGLKGDEFGLSVGSTKLPRLTAPGVSKLEGRLLLRTLDCRAAFDNLDISNRAE